MKKFTKVVKRVTGTKVTWYHLEDEETGLGVMCTTRNYRRLKKVLQEELKKC